MAILISGGSGLIGSKLINELRKKGHQVKVLVRRTPKQENDFFWDYRNKIIDDEALDNVDCIIHLAGANIGKRWTTAYKKEIIDSRIDSANFLLEKCKEKQISLNSFISASGINYYGTFNSDKILTEENGILHNDFLSQVCDLWEKAAFGFSDISERIVILRTAPVLAKNGGSFQKLKNISDFHLASGIANGKQWFSWIHINDMVNLYLEAVENPDMKHIYNAVADETPTQKEFMKTLASVNKKLFFPINVPSFIMKIAFGEMSEIILKGSRISNEKVKSLGFKFQFPKLKTALEDLLQ
ncbi:MAG: TIGR01777 family oxidoreductase [Cruoricaptor ignavus]|nr:TIGR01777 family oxidoreductase [Cruoricaptor ignavus]